MGVFRVLDFREAGDSLRFAVGGDSFIAAIEFGPTLRAYGLLAYGNASRIGSPHRTDQLGLAAAQRLRPIWRTRVEIEAHLERRAVY
jgi:acyl-homoserine-lactone acylase